MIFEKSEPLPLTGYADRLSARPGEAINFMISSKFDSYEAHIVRLIHGDPNPEGPGFKSEAVETDLHGPHPGRVQKFNHGSYIVIKNKPQFRTLSSFTIQCWIYPTTPNKGVRAIVCQWSDGEKKSSAYGLFIDEYGELALWVRDRNGSTAKLKSGKPLIPFYWYFVAVSFDGDHSKATLIQKVVQPCEESDSDSFVVRELSVDGPGKNEADITIAAYFDQNGSRHPSYNGKIDGVKLFSKALDLRQGVKFENPLPPNYKRYLLINLDFAHDASSPTIRDTSNTGVQGNAVNLPQRAVTGHNWSGNFQDFRAAPEEYNAIYFHDDDQGDAGWKVDFRLRIPKNLQSGVYAARLEAEGHEDYIPFFVLPRKRGKKAKIAFLAPTLSYLAYANERTIHTSGIREVLGNTNANYPVQSQDAYIVANTLTSLYDHHMDGSGVCYSSRLRPIVNMRPKYNMPGLYLGKGAPHQFNADLHLIDWLQVKGFDHDVITDEDLHYEGRELIDDYKVIATGSHPEYWTEQMLDTMISYLNNGGRLMYLGGNGFYWVTTINPDQPDVFEVRRWGGTGTLKADPGEFHNSSTGEMGGLWRNRGRAPQKMLGVGFTSQGFDSNRPYVRAPESFDEKVAFIFEGIGKEEKIGDFPSLVQNRGAAGFELDRLDYTLGTPAHSILLATATGFSNSYQHAIEENTMSDDKQGGEYNKKVRADMVFTPYPKGGAVFSVGSIAWCASLSYNKYDNTVSRLTANVLKNFARDEPLL